MSKGSERTQTCSLCKATGHWSQDCQQYTSPKEKYDRLREIGGCTRCSNANHEGKDCYKSKKLKCRNCAGAHFEYLCISGQEKKKGPKKGTQVNLAGLECLSGTTSANTLLGTLTCEVHRGRPLRALKDSGSQSNFVAKAALTDTNHKIIDRSVHLSIRGINCVGEKRTMEVEMLLKFDGAKKPRPVRLYVLDEIPTALSLPKLGVLVGQFKSKGYQLADRSLNENSVGIKNLDLILGANEILQLDEKPVRLGKESGYISTKCGVILQGNLDQLITDSEQLKNLAKVEQGSKSTSGIEMCALTAATEEQATVVKDDLNDMILEFQEYGFPLENSEEKGEEIIEDDRAVESDREAMEYLIKECKISPEGRIIMPLLFVSKVKHLLPDNYNLAQVILHGLYKKYKDDPEKLNLMNYSIQEL